MLKIYSAFLFLFIANISFAQNDQDSIQDLIISWHQAAADTDYETYFSKMAEQSTFIGTDATENWNKQEFMAWSKPYFDKGKAWSFTTLQRNVFLNDDKKIAWFDELLETQMGICRGSGVVVKEKGEWKIKHYVLSITIPNTKVEAVTEIKRDHDQKMVQALRD